MSYPAGNRVDPNRIAFEKHPNPYNLKLSTVRSRINIYGKTFEEAMSYPAGQNILEIFKNGWVMFKDEWTYVSDLEMILDQEITENMLKTGIEAEKLFKRKE